MTMIKHSYRGHDIVAFFGSSRWSVTVDHIPLDLRLHSSSWQAIQHAIRAIDDAWEAQERAAQRGPGSRAAPHPAAHRERWSLGKGDAAPPRRGALDACQMCEGTGSTVHYAESVLDGTVVAECQNCRGSGRVGGLRRAPPRLEVIEGGA